MSEYVVGLKYMDLPSAYSVSFVERMDKYVEGPAWKSPLHEGWPALTLQEDSSRPTAPT